MNKRPAIILAPTAEIAQDLVIQFRQAGVPFSTVEAEYGDIVIEGTHATLAHHSGEWRKFPAPCNRKDIQPMDGGYILISHIDLDTVGGILRLIHGNDDPFFRDGAFWEGAEFIDLNGPHRVYELDKGVREELQAVWAWVASQPRGERVTDATDVTNIIEDWGQALSYLIEPEDYSDADRKYVELIKAGQEWAADLENAQEACLVLSVPEKVRVFVTEDVSTAAAYREPETGFIYPATVTFNKKLGSITVATSNGAFNAREVVQSLWGPEAGGHPGIAGSPRGQVMTENDLQDAMSLVVERVG